MNADPGALSNKWSLLAGACRDPALSKAEVAVLASILERVNRSTGEAFPGLGTIAKDSAVARCTVVRAVAKLIAAGYVFRTTGSAKKSNTYRINDARGLDQPRCTDAPSITDAPRCTDEPDLGASTHLDLGAPVHPEQVKREPIELTSEKKTRARKPRADLTVTLPNWLPEESWQEFVEHRKQLGKAMRQLAADKQLAALTKLHESGHDVVALIDTAIANGWQGIYPPKDGSSNQSYRKLSVVEQVEAACNERERKRRALSVAATFTGKTHTGTPLEQLPVFLRPVDVEEQAIADAERAIEVLGGSR